MQGISRGCSDPAGIPNTWVDVNTRWKLLTREERPDLANWERPERIRELPRLEKPSRITKSSCSTSTAKATTALCPQVPHPQGFKISRDSTPALGNNSFLEDFPNIQPEPPFLQQELEPQKGICEFPKNQRRGEWRRKELWE